MLAYWGYPAAARKATIHICDMIQGKELRSWDTRGHYLGDLAFSPDGKILASAATAEWAGNQRKADPTVFLWDVGTGTLLHRLPGMDTRFITFVNNRTVATGESGAVTFWNVATGRPLREVRHSETQRFAFSSDGKWLATAGTSPPTIPLREVVTGVQSEAFLLAVEGFGDSSPPPAG